MIRILLCFLVILSSCAVKRDIQPAIDEVHVKKIISTLAADEMLGRGVFTPSIDSAANFISREFKNAGLKTLPNTDSYLQHFNAIQVKPSICEITINGEVLPNNKAFVISEQTGLNWNDNPEIIARSIANGDNFRKKYREIIAENKDAVIYVNEVFSEEFNQLRQHIQGGRIFSGQLEEGKASYIFVMGNEVAKSFRVNYAGAVTRGKLANVVGILPGKSRPNEYVVFSGHYDHLGIIEPVGQDSIANGADDDASGVTAVISLANIFAKQVNNERTLVFVAFTAEESGGFGSKYFSEQLNPKDVVAMINIEMIGKDSKFGPNTLYITGFEKSDLGKIMQANAKRTDFAFYPDPYPDQNLFYRSDNATLAALGVPAHTASTSQIDQDKFYHTVKDELQTLDIKNIISSIKAIAAGTASIISGKDTPTRIPPLKN
jgi:hypothetical protein